jgi:hypothetical protein
MGNGDGMQINHAKKRVVAVLQIHPVADGAKPIAQVQRPGWLNP